MNPAFGAGGRGPFRGQDATCSRRHHFIKAAGVLLADRPATGWTPQGPDASAALSAGDGPAHTGRYFGGLRPSLRAAIIENDVVRP